LWSGILERFSRSPAAFHIIQNALNDSDAATVAAGAAAAAAAAEVDVLRKVWLRNVPVEGRRENTGEQLESENPLPSLARLLTTAR
jgi:hypothetical protein